MQESFTCSISFLFYLSVITDVELKLIVAKLVANSHARVAHIEEEEE